MAEVVDSHKTDNEREQDTILEQISELQKRLVALRREAQPQPIEDYQVQTHDGIVSLSSLFGDRSDMLLIHNMGTGCAYCTLWADEINGVLPHLLNRTAVIFSTPNTVEVQKKFASSRGWNFTMISGAAKMTTDLGFMPEGDWWPGVSALQRRKDGSIVHVGKDWFGPGDAYCSVWHFLDLLADGANGWEPEFSYS
jgi:predicted dithiol-disulfide oxidoreductase (DUF899 family)